MLRIGTPVSESGSRTKVSGNNGPKTSQWHMLGSACFIAIVLACFAIAPVSAGERYMTGSPELTAAVSGTNEFSPGDSVVIAVQLQNEGLNELKFVGSGIIDRDDQPNTAKLITATLGSGDSPLIIKSDPQMIGDLKGGSSTIIKFNVKIPKDAMVGTYDLPLNLDYRYLWMAEQMGTDSIQYVYNDVKETLYLPVKIKPVLQFSIISADTEHLNAGTEGYLTLVVNNTGQENGMKAIVKIAQNDNSMIIPTDASSYIGDFPVGAEITSTFKISVKDEAESKTYPLDVYINYENSEGDFVDSERTTIGIPVGGKTEFTVVSDPIEISSGQERAVTVQYKNTGDATVYSAQARISAVDPFTSNDDTAFLGTIAPGEMKEATFKISVDSTATEKEYGLDSEVRYRDALDNSIISDPIKVRIEVVEQSNTGLYLMIGLIAVGIIGGGYFYHLRRQKGNGEVKSG